MNRRTEFHRPEWNRMRLAEGASVMSKNQNYDLTDESFPSMSRILEQAALAENYVLEGKQQ